MDVESGTVTVPQHILVREWAYRRRLRIDKSVTLSADKPDEKHPEGRIVPDRTNLSVSRLKDRRRC